jgi:hypothetical protein
LQWLDESSAKEARDFRVKNSCSGSAVLEEQETSSKFYLWTRFVMFTGKGRLKNKRKEVAHTKLQYHKLRM